MSMKNNNRKIVVVVGPTASGKSGFAVKLAKKIKGEVISADSRQVYKGLNIGTGKITKKEMMGIPHHLLDVVSPKRIFTVTQYRKLTLKAIQDIWKRGNTPILCGGTGFYIQSVIDGINIPNVKPNSKLRRELNKESAEELFQQLKKKDPERARTIDARNKVRLVRALEIVDSLGSVPMLKKNPIKSTVLMIGIKRGGDELKKLIHNRLIKRLKNGMVEEVQKLHSNGLSWDRLHDLGLEYRYIALLLQKRITKKELVEILEREIRHYAKRQMTWFKKDKRINWITNTNPVPSPALQRPPAFSE